MGRKKARKTNSGAKARAKDRSTAVSQNVKVNVESGGSRRNALGRGSTSLRGRLGQRPSYTMPSFGGGGSASVHVSVPHPLPSFDQQMGYSIHTLSSNVDNLVRYLQQTQGAQPIPGPSSEAIARTAVMNTTGTQTDSVPAGASQDLRDLDLFANMPSAPVIPTSQREGGSASHRDWIARRAMPPEGLTQSNSTQTDDVKAESVPRPSVADVATDPSAPSMRTKKTQTSVRTADMGTDPIGPATTSTGSDPIGPSVRSFGTSTDDAGVGSSSSGPRMASASTQTMLGQSVATNTDPLFFNDGDRSRVLPPRPQRMDFDMARTPASKRKSDSDHTGMTGTVGRPEYSDMPALTSGQNGAAIQTPNGLGPRPHPFEGLVGRYPFVYPRQYRFDGEEAVPMGRFNFADNERPNAKRKRDDGASQGGVQKMQRVGRRPRRNEAQILRDENALRAAMGH